MAHDIVTFNQVALRPYDNDDGSFMVQIPEVFYGALCNEHIGSIFPKAYNFEPYDYRVFMMNDALNVNGTLNDAIHALLGLYNSRS